MAALLDHSMNQLNLDAHPSVEKPSAHGAPSSTSSADPAAEEPAVSEFRKRELAGELKPEMLLTENPKRFVIFPIQHNDVRARIARYTSCHRSDTRAFREADRGP